MPAAKPVRQLPMEVYSEPESDQQTSVNAPPASMPRQPEELDHVYKHLPGEDFLEEAYETIGDAIGAGTYGTVWRARCLRSGQKVAIKKVMLPKDRLGEGFPVSSIREIQSLKRLATHKNIVSLLEIAVAPNDASVHLVMEYCPMDLTGLLEYRKRNLELAEAKCIMRQLADSLDFCHFNNIMHRDLKPANILVTAKGIVKLCDFGLSRLSVTGPGVYTSSVITLWYRPPELLFSPDSPDGKPAASCHYGCSVDVWSAACILGELLLSDPLFHEKAEPQVLRKIGERCGAGAASKEWPDAMQASPAFAKLMSAPCVSRSSGNVYAEVRRKRGALGAKLLREMLQLDPQRRIRIGGDGGVLQHAFFSQEPLPCDPEKMKMPPSDLPLHELAVVKHWQRLVEEQEAARQKGRTAEPAARRSRSPRRDAQH